MTRFASDWCAHVIRRATGCMPDIDTSRDVRGLNAYVVNLPVAVMRSVLASAGAPPAWVALVKAWELDTDPESSDAVAATWHPEGGV